jgi:rhodanese-related sulfurtransferase
MALKDDICSAMENYMMTSPPDWNVVNVKDLKKELDSGQKVFLLDVREPAEYEAGHIEGAVNVSVKELPRRVKELPQDRGIRMVAYCASGIRSAYATMFLRVYGYKDVRTMEHGIREWTGAGYPVVR